MSEYRKQAAFLKAIMMYEDSTEHRVLKEQLSNAERNERCLLYACRLVGLIALLGLAGLGYSAVLLPEFFDNATHVIIQFFSALGLGSLMCLTVFVGLWLWYRSAVNRIHDECRRVITKMLESRLKTTTTTFYPVVTEDPNLSLSSVTNAAQSPSSGLISLRKAS